MALLRASVVQRQATEGGLLFRIKKEQNPIFMQKYKVFGFHSKNFCYICSVL